MKRFDLFITFPLLDIDKKFLSGRFAGEQNVAVLFLTVFGPPRSITHFTEFHRQRRSTIGNNRSRIVFVSDAKQLRTLRRCANCADMLDEVKNEGGRHTPARHPGYGFGRP